MTRRGGEAADQPTSSRAPEGADADETAAAEGTGSAGDARAQTVAAAAETAAGTVDADAERAPGDPAASDPAVKAPRARKPRSRAPRAKRSSDAADPPVDAGIVEPPTLSPVAPPAPPAPPTAHVTPADRRTDPPVHRARQRVAVIIPAKDESRRIAATVRSAKAIPHVDLVLVVDDGSEDNTQHVAREAGAVVVRHSHNRGKAAAMETGAAVVAMRDAPDRQPRVLLFVDGDLGETAVNTAPLVPPVLEGHADLAIALIPPQPGAGGHGFVVGAARRAIASLTGWTPTQPLSGMRCLTREAFEAATPLAHGWGVEAGMTIDLLRQGFRVVEVPCDLRHRPSGTDLRGQLHRAAQYRDVQLAVNARRLRGAAGAVKRTVQPRNRPPQTHL